jgi:outer membrane protein assembly factor BamB
MLPRPLITLACALVLIAICSSPSRAQAADAEAKWPQFRGAEASGSARTPGPVKWNIGASKNVLWNVAVPGLGHSAPVVWGDRIFLTTALPLLPDGGDQNLKTGLYGDIEPVEENAEYRWLVLCLDKNTGKTLWQDEARRGVPKVKRHPKSTHANSTPATDGKRVVAFFGSEGLHCFDLDGKPLWQRDFGLLDSGYYVVPDAQWGFASSPVLFDDKVIILADVQRGSFVATLNASDGKEIWRTPRTDVPTWGTPTVHAGDRRTQVLVNGYKEIAGYDLADGKKLWTMNGGGDIPVPTPIVAHDLMFFTSAHGPQAPIFAIKTSAEGDITLPKGESSSDHVAWSNQRGGNYMQTPIVVGDYFYCCRDNGLLTCYEAKTGKQTYRTRLDGNGFTASGVAAGDRLYFTSEDGRVHVVKAGPAFESLAINDLGEQCLATPAVSNGTIFFRTKGHLIAIGGE